MRRFARFTNSSVKWYLLGIATAVAAGWLSRSTKPSPPAVERAAESAPRPPRPEDLALVQRARATEAAGDSAAARSAYLEAADRLPPIRDYLLLRAALLAPDSVERRALYQQIGSSPVREQVGITEARILEKTGDLEGAASRREALGQPAEVFRLRLASARDPGALKLVLRELVGWVSDSSTSPLRGPVAAAGIPHIRQLSAPQQLTLARGSASAGVRTPAIAFFSAAARGGARLGASDYAAWGEALFLSGKYREAAVPLARVTTGSDVPVSLLLRGRALLRSGRSGGRAVLESLARRFPEDTTATPTALFLLGDLARDAGDYRTARSHWNALGRRFPSSSSAPRARFLAALILYSQSRPAEAATEWDSLFSSDWGKEEALAAGYWAGRAYHESGDSARANARWRQVIARSHLSYYSRLAHRRLGIRDSTIQPGVDTFPASGEVEAAEERLNLLAATGLTAELGMEATWLAGKAGDDLDRVLGIAPLLREHFRAASTAQLGWRALEQGAADSRTYRLIFPLLFADPLVAAARAERVEPALTAALIRQESLFDSMATSRAGARGLMQVMPAVGRDLARTAGKTAWHSDSLYQPRFNLELGNAHLAWALGRYGGLERTLAAYNAGGSRVTRWARYPGSADPELFTEWIPFPETRTYVRTVLRNLEFYRALYDW